MVRSFVLLILLSGMAPGAVWPDRFGPFQRVSAAPIGAEPGHKAVWDEIGLVATESAEYAAGKRKLTAQAWQMHDSTGAYAAFEWLRPAGAKPVELGQSDQATGVSLGQIGLVAIGNYLLRFDGYIPKPDEVKVLTAALPQFHNAPFPGLAQYLPAKGRVSGSERYVVGPAGLQMFAPGIPAGAVGFQFSAEAEIAAYKTPAGQQQLALFYYPTPAIARVQLAEFQKLTGISAKRSGPLVGVVAGPPDAARWLLDQVNYQAKITLNERVPTRRDNVGDLIVNVFTLAGLLLLICLGGGLAVGGFRAFASRQGRETMTLLHLEDRR